MPGALDAASLKRIHTFLSNLETMTFAEACQGGRKAKVIRVKDMPTRAQKYLRDKKQDDTAELVELLLGSKQRIWAVQIGTIFHVMWWDLEHEVWPAAKRHT